MKIELRGVLREDAGKDHIILTIEETVSLEAVKNLIGIDPGISVVACIDGKQLKSNCQFRNGDSITLLPVVAGG